MTREPSRAADAADLRTSVVPPDGRTGALRVVVVARGKVRHGVESHSVMLHAEDGRKYQLSGAYSRLSGRMVLVRGQIRSDLSTTTQQGPVLRVESIETIDDGEHFSLR